MAFLTYRQSDQTVTEAQKQRQNIILGVPLTMYHVDANFKAISDELKDIKLKYGVGVTHRDDQMSISEIFGSNDVDAIVNSGFYKLSASTHRPDNVNNSVLIHAQSADGGVDDITAIQVTAGIDDTGAQVLYYRTKQGQNTWNQWQSFISNVDIDVSIAQLEQVIEDCVKKAGDSMSGPLILNNKLQLTGNNDMISTSARKGSAPSANTTDGFNVFDNSGTINESTKLGFFGLKQTSAGFSGMSLSAINPISTNSTQTAEMQVGWKQNTSGTFVPYTYAPTPTIDDPNQIATTGWVDNKVANILIEEGILTDQGGLITGNVEIEGDVEISGDSDFNNVYVDGESLFVRPPAVIVPYNKGTWPDTGVAGNGYRIIDATENNDPGSTGGEFWGSVNNHGAFTAEIAAYRWVSSSAPGRWRIALTVSNDGNTVTTEAPTPPANDNSQQIATTEWSRNTINTITDAKIDEYERTHPWDLGVL